MENIARIHKLDWKALGLSFLSVPGGGTDPLDRELEYWERYLNWVKESPEEPQPILEAALSWLREHPYVPRHVSLCWGDYRLPNTIYSPEGEVLGLLDWEMAYLGDPESDLAFSLFNDWATGEAYGVPRLKGTPGREEAVRRYEELTGWKVENLFYQDVLAALRAGVVTLKVLKNLKNLGGAQPAR